MMSRPKHLFRGTSLVLGSILLFLGLCDGYNNVFPYLDSQWLLAVGVILVGLAARKRPIST